MKASHFRGFTLTKSVVLNRVALSGLCAALLIVVCASASAQTCNDTWNQVCQGHPEITCTTDDCSLSIHSQSHDAQVLWNGTPQPVLCIALGQKVIWTEADAGAVFVVGFGAQGPFRNNKTVFGGVSDSGIVVKDKCWKYTISQYCGGPVPCALADPKVIINGVRFKPPGKQE